MDIHSSVIRYKRGKLKGFNISSKEEKIANYLRIHNIDTVHLGISGGIDSAVVAGLLLNIKQFRMPELKVKCYFIDFSEYDGIFKPGYVDDIMWYIRTRGGEVYSLNGNDSLDALLVDGAIADASDHVRAQVSYALRYQILFARAQYDGGITFGTTNRDEFEYSGWFGKTSDMVVDVQPIANWHKFEVVEAAYRLNVPRSIIERTPTGDTIDGLTDEENFGCTYDELSWLTNYRDVVLDVPGFQDKFKKLIALHERNAHKYQGQTFNPVFIR